MSPGVTQRNPVSKKRKRKERKEKEQKRERGKEKKGKEKRKEKKGKERKEGRKEKKEKKLDIYKALNRTVDLSRWIVKEVPDYSKGILEGLLKFISPHTEASYVCKITIKIFNN